MTQLVEHKSRTVRVREHLGKVMLVTSAFVISSSALAADDAATNLLTSFKFDTSPIVTFIGMLFAAVVTVGTAYMSIPMVTKGLKAIRASFS